MKTKEEIEQLGKEEYPSIIGTTQNGVGYDMNAREKEAYRKGYTQCQVDMADKKYTEEDMIGFFEWSLGMEVVEMICHNKTKQEIFKVYLNSLNKQD
jgi:hypothetical protein